jgi:HEPN domain-containing protein
MSRIEDWLLSSELDLKAARASLRENVPNIACFLSQQAVEKVFKAVILAKAGKVPKIHALDRLFDQIQPILPACSVDFEKQVLFLDKFYIPTRYPDTLPGSLPEGLPTEDVAEKAIAYATEIVEFVKPLF